MRINKWRFVIIITIICSVCFIGCSSSANTFASIISPMTFDTTKDDNPVTSIILSTKRIYLTIGQSYVLLATVSPSNAKNPDISWYCDNTDILVVGNGNVGTVLPNAKGSAIIKAVTKNGQSDSCLVIVVDKVADLLLTESGIMLSCTNISLKVGEVLAINYIYDSLPEDWNLFWEGTTDYRVANIAFADWAEISAEEIGSDVITVYFQTSNDDFKDSLYLIVSE